MNPSLRPAVYDEDTGWAYVDLTDADLAAVYQTARARYEENRKSANADGAFRSGMAEKIDIEGLLGEYAFCLLGGELPKESDLVLPFSEWTVRRGVNGGELTDFRGAEIRATTWPNGGIFVHKDGTRDGEKKLDAVFILAVVKNLAPFAGKDAQPHYSRRVVFKGWCFGRDATNIRQDVVSPEYFVEQRNLHPMGQLADKLFVLPRTVRALRAEKLQKEQALGEALLAEWAKGLDESFVDAAE